MKIPDQNIGMQMDKALLKPQAPAEAVDRKQNKPTVEQQSAAPAADRVEISDKARDVQRLNQLVLEVPEVRTEKVEALKKQVTAGTYGADGKAVAQKMVESTLLDKVL